MYATKDPESVKLETVCVIKHNIINDLRKFVLVLLINALLGIAYVLLACRYC